MSPKSTPSAAAIVLCAGKGTRMGTSARNKVCTPCAGVPVVRRILANLRAGGVSRFVVVTGHRAESVMRALDGEHGVLFAYQREQLGTGDATLCGLRVLQDVGHTGPVVVTMGDKIVSPRLVRELLGADAMALAVCGVQRREEHPNGGHVVMDGDRALGIVEYADVRKALADGRDIALGGRTFPASEVAATPWVNTALYRFDAAALAAALALCGRDNAQGEVYLTDTIELFASGRVFMPGRGALPRDRPSPPVRIYHVADPADLLTFSTKEEFRCLNARFLRPAGALLADYPQHRAVLEAFIVRYGAERPAVLVRAPGRVNLMGRHVEHRGGSVNVLATEAATVFVAAPRADATVRMANLDPAYAEESFAVVGASDAHAPLHGDAATRAWLAWLARPEVRAALAASRGAWTNYVKGAVYRLQRATDLSLCGMDVVAEGNIPVAAGLSSSSSVVVASTSNRPNSCRSAARRSGSWGAAAARATMRRCSAAGRARSHASTSRRSEWGRRCGFLRDTPCLWRIPLSRRRRAKAAATVSTHAWRPTNSRFCSCVGRFRNGSSPCSATSRGCVPSQRATAFCAQSRARPRATPCARSCRRAGSVLTRFSPRMPTRACTTCAAWRCSVSVNARARRARWTC